MALRPFQPRVCSSDQDLAQVDDLVGDPADYGAGEFALHRFSALAALRQAFERSLNGVERLYAYQTYVATQRHSSAATRLKHRAVHHKPESLLRYSACSRRLAGELDAVLSNYRLFCDLIECPTLTAEQEWLDEGQLADHEQESAHAAKESAVGLSAAIIWAVL